MTTQPTEWYAAKDASEANGHPRRAAQPFTYPPTAAVSAALEERLETAQRAYDSTPRDETEERAFWRRQVRAYINALADWTAGRVPMVVGDSYIVPSASRAGSYH